MAAQNGARLAVKLGGDAGWFEASCVQLRLLGGGESADEAMESLVECTKLLVRYLEGLNGFAAADDRSRYVALIRAHWDRLGDVFERP